MFWKKRKERDNVIMLRNELITNNFRVSSSKLKYLTNNGVNSNNIVVSLTSYSKRVHDVYLVLESIALQTVKPDRVILWLSEDEYDINSIPKTLSNRIPFGLEVKFCKDIKSYKKIIPTLELCPDNIIVTIDDDYLYPHDTVENLLSEHLKYPDAILGNRAHEITLKNGKVDEYRQWKKEVEHQSDKVFLTGCGAILYPPKSLYDSVTNQNLFMDLCPHADDIWLFAMAKLNKTEIRKANGRDFSDFVELQGNRDMGLNNFNVKGRGNNSQFEAVANYFQLNF